MLGKRELIESLRTKDRETAKRLCHVKEVEVDHLFEAARRGVELSQPEAEAVAGRWFDKALADDAERRALGDNVRSALVIVDDDEHLAHDELVAARAALAGGDAASSRRAFGATLVVLS